MFFMWLACSPQPSVVAGGATHTVGTLSTPGDTGTGTGTDDGTGTDTSTPPATANERAELVEVDWTEPRQPHTILEAPEQPGRSWLVRAEPLGPDGELVLAVDVIVASETVGWPPTYEEAWMWIRPPVPAGRVDVYDLWDGIPQSPALPFAAGDVDGDGHADAWSHSVLTSHPSMHGVDAPILGQLGVDQWVVEAPRDLDGDGFDDLVVLGATHGGAEVHYGPLPAPATQVVSYTTDHWKYGEAHLIPNLQGAGRHVLLVKAGTLNAQTWAYELNHERGRTHGPEDALAVLAGSWHFGVHPVGDLDGDGASEVLNGGELLRGPLRQQEVDDEPDTWPLVEGAHIVAPVGDLNGDELDDFLLNSADGPTLLVSPHAWPLDPAQGVPVDLTCTSPDRDEIAVADLDLDGWPDVACAGGADTDHWELPIYSGHDLMSAWESRYPPSAP